MRKAKRRIDRKRCRRSNREKAELVERWCESGLSRAEFCRREEICYGSFVRWIAEWMEQDEEGPEFVEVVEAVCEEGRSDDGSGGIEVVAPNGWRVRVRGGFESRDLERVVEVLGRC